MTKQATIFAANDVLKAENDGLKAALSNITQASQQRSQVTFFMVLEGLGSLVAAAKSGDPGAKRICNEVKSLLRDVDALASDIVIPGR